MTADGPVCVVLSGAGGSGIAAAAAMFAGAGFDPPADAPAGRPSSPGAAGVGDAFLAALGRAGDEPEPLPEGCFSGPEAVRARAGVAAFLDRNAPRSGRLLLADPSLARLGPLWLPELKAWFRAVVAVHALRRAGGAGTDPAAAGRSARSDLLWLHRNLEFESWTRGERRIVLPLEELEDPEADPGPVLRRVAAELGPLPAGALAWPRPPDDASSRPAPAPRAGPPASRDTVLEAVYRALRDPAGGDTAWLDAARANLATVAPAPGQERPGPDGAKILHRARLRRAAGMCEHRPDAPAAPPRRAPAGRTAPRKPARNPPFLFVSGAPAARSHLYRVANPVDGLRRLGAAACWISAETLARRGVAGLEARCAIVHRCAFDPAIERLFDRCKRLGVPVGFDIDDLVFDPETIRRGDVRFVAAAPRAERERWLALAAGYRRAMAAADFAVAPTRPLADRARRVAPRAYVVENGFNADTLALSEYWRRRRASGAAARLGYASGTPTHAADFATAAGPLAEALWRAPEAVFAAVGHLDLRPHADLLPPDRVEVRPWVEHVHLAHELARFDVNLVPLEAGNPFCDAKSPLKYFEAAIAGAPTVATANPVYEDAIRHGETGLLARSAEEWTDALARLARDPRERARLAARAREACLARFHADRLAEKYLRLPM